MTTIKPIKIHTLETIRDIILNIVPEPNPMPQIIRLLEAEGIVFQSKDQDSSYKSACSTTSGAQCPLEQEL